MPVPRPDKVTELVVPVLAAAGAELDAVTVVAAGRRSVVRVVVDAEDGLDLDAVATLTRQVSDVLDAEESFGQAPYTLEVTTPGTARPLTLPRHWRRNRGRRVQVTLTEAAGGDVLTVRAGPVTGEGEQGGERVLLVLPAARAKDAPTTREVALGDVEHAVVEVEFSPPDPAETELSGGPRPTPTTQPEHDSDEEHDEEHDSDEHEEAAP